MTNEDPGWHCSLDRGGLFRVNQWYCAQLESGCPSRTSLFCWPALAPAKHSPWARRRTRHPEQRPSTSRRGAIGKVPVPSWEGLEQIESGPQHPRSFHHGTGACTATSMSGTVQSGKCLGPFFPKCRTCHAASRMRHSPRLLGPMAMLSTPHLPEELADQALTFSTSCFPLHRIDPIGTPNWGANLNWARSIWFFWVWM